MTTIDYENVRHRGRSRRVVRWAVGVTASVIVVANSDRIVRNVIDPAPTASLATRVSGVLSLSIFVAIYAAIAAGSFGRRRWVSAVAAGATLTLFDGLARQVGTAIAELSHRPDVASQFEMLTRGFFVQTWVGLILATYLLLPSFAAALATRGARAELERIARPSPIGLPMLSRFEAVALAWLPLDRQTSFATSIASVAGIIEGLFWVATVPGRVVRQQASTSTPPPTMIGQPAATDSAWTVLVFALGIAWIAAGVHAARSDDRPRRSSAMRYLVALACTSVLWSMHEHWYLLSGIARGIITVRYVAPAWVGQLDGIVAEVMIVGAFAWLARRAGAVDSATDAVDPAADAVDPLTPHTR